MTFTDTLSSDLTLSSAFASSTSQENQLKVRNRQASTGIAYATRPDLRKYAMLMLISLPFQILLKSPKSRVLQNTSRILSSFKNSRFDRFRGGL
jgi:hypothetical protein